MKIDEVTGSNPTTTKLTTPPVETPPDEPHDDESEVPPIPEPEPPQQTQKPSAILEGCGVTST